MREGLLLTHAVPTLIICVKINCSICWGLCWLLNGLNFPGCRLHMQWHHFRMSGNTSWHTVHKSVIWRCVSCSISQINCFSKTDVQLIQSNKNQHSHIKFESTYFNFICCYCKFTKCIVVQKMCPISVLASELVFLWNAFACRFIYKPHFIGNSHADFLGLQLILRIPQS